MRWSTNSTPMFREPSSVWTRLTSLAPPEQMRFCQRTSQVGVLCLFQAHLYAVARQRQRHQHQLEALSPAQSALAFKSSWHSVLSSVHLLWTCTFCADAISQAAAATAEAIKRGNTRCQVEILLPEFWDPISGQTLCQQTTLTLRACSTARIHIMRLTAAPTADTVNTLPQRVSVQTCAFVLPCLTETCVLSWPG